MSSETTAKEIMTRDLIRATEDMTIEEALKVLINHRITGLPVVDKKGKMKGVISEYDILSQISGSKKKNARIFQDKISYSKKIDAINEDTPLSKIVSEFIDTKYRRLPVIDRKGNLVGIITRRDLMKVYYYRARLEA
ncbi:MAG: CBS domain-containing protein [Bdellovibrionales bacterium]|nr:CBS domain-containing protein [Bdellovibrionales bacterium]